MQRLIPISLLVAASLAGAAPAQELDTLLKLNEETLLKRSLELQRQSGNQAEADALLQMLVDMGAADPARLWLHVYDTTPREKINALQDAFVSFEFQTRAQKLGLVVKPTQVVDSGPQQAQLRYFKPGDAELAQLVAGRLSEVYGAPVVARDLSAQYSDANWLEAGHLEFWAGKGD